MAAVNEEIRDKWNQDSLTQLVKCSIKSLLSESTQEKENLLTVKIKKQRRDENEEWVRDKQEDDSFRECNSDIDGNNLEEKMKSFYKYALKEWTTNKWISTWSGNDWGTSWIEKSVMMTGIDSQNSKKILLKLDLPNKPDHYVIGQYESSKGVLTLGINTCTIRSGFQCQINKNVPISSQRINMTFLSY